MNRFWQIAIGSCLVGMSLIATGCGKDSTASVARLKESAVGLSGQPLAAVAALDQQRVGGWYRLIARHSGKCLGVSDSSRDNGAKLIQWECTGGFEQRFIFRDLSDGYIDIQPQHVNFGACLGVSQGKLDNGANVIQWDCTGGKEQQFVLEGVGDGYYRLRPRHSGKCLGVRESSQDNGAEVIQWDCGDVFDQHFKLERV